MRQYAKMRKEFLSGKLCEVCQKEHSRTREPDEIHHIAGRNNDRLLMTQYWLPVCWSCHWEIHDNPAWARERGYLKPFVQFDS